MRKILKIIIFILSILIFSINLLVTSANDKKILDIKINIPVFIPQNDKVTKEYISVKNSEVYKSKYFKGFLEISGTDFKEALYQYSNNDYFLTHNGLGQKKSSGATYLDYRINSTSKKILIYGHNNDKLSLPFSILENYNDFDYYKEHKYLTLTFDDVKYKYEIFSVYIETSNWDYMNIKFSSNSLYKSHLNDLKSRSIYDTGVEINGNEKIIILQTCSKNKEYSSYDKKYMLIIGKLIEE